MKIKTLLSASILAVLVAGALAQDAGTKLSYTGPAAPVSTVLEGLSKKAGVSLTAAVTLRDSVVYLRIKDVSLDDAMKHIADVLNAEWTKTNDGYMLGRGSNLIAADVRAETNAKVAKIQQQIAEMRDAIGKEGAWNEASANKLAAEQKKVQDDLNRKFEQAGNRSISFSNIDDSATNPGKRAIVAILANMTPNQLAAIASGTRTVFSTNATRMQLPLGSGGSRICEQFVKDQLILSKAMGTKGPAASEPGVRRMVFSTSSGFNSGDGPMGPGNPALGVGVSMLISSRAPFSTGSALTLVVADKNGQTLSSASMQLDIEGIVTKPEPPKKSETPIKLSPLAEEFAKMLNFGRESGGAERVQVTSIAIASSGSVFRMNSIGAPSPQPPISPELRNALLNPETIEPMTLGPNDAMDAIAEASGKNVVAYLPDSILTSATRFLAMKKSVPDFIFFADQALNLETTKTDEWTSIEPRAHASAEARKINRIALGKLLKSLNAKGYVRLDEIAAFSLAQNKAPSEGDIDVAFMRGINSGCTNETFLPLGRDDDWSMVQLYGLLTPAQKQDLANGNGLRLGTVSPAQRNLISDQIFNSLDGPTLEDPSQKPFGLRGRVMMFGAPAVGNERTFLLPNGVPNDGILKLATSSQTVAQGYFEGGGSQLFTTDSLAFAKVMAENPNTLPGDGMAPETAKKYLSATQTNLDFTFQLAATVSMTRGLDDLLLGNRGQAGLYDTLPKTFRDEVDLKASKLKESFKRGNFSGNRGTPPPRP